MENVRAAGIAFTTPSGYVLFIRRAIGDEMGKWCLPGGLSDGDETPLATAIREAREETGWIKSEDDDSEPYEVDKQPNGYVVFKKHVSEFIPRLDHEHDAWAWAKPSDPPQPLHPSLAERMAIIGKDQARG